MPSDFIKLWVNSLVIVNGTEWKISEFIGLVNEDKWIAPTFCSNAIIILFLKYHKGDNNKFIKLG
jgi:hypothetical protein